MSGVKKKMNVKIKDNKGSDKKMPSLVLVALLTLVFLRESIYNKGNIKRELKVGPLYASWLSLWILYYS